MNIARTLVAADFLLLVLIIGCRKEQPIDTNAIVDFWLEDSVSPLYAVFRLNEDVRTATLTLDDSLEYYSNGQDTIKLLISEAGIHRAVVNATGKESRRMTGSVEFFVPPAAKKITIKGFVKIGMSGNFFLRDSVLSGLRYSGSNQDIYFMQTYSTSFLNENDTVIFDQQVIFNVFSDGNYSYDNINHISILMESMPSMTEPYIMYFWGGFYIGAAYWERLYCERDIINLNGGTDALQVKLLVKWE